jgi:hypothetical protein
MDHRDALNLYTAARAKQESGESTAYHLIDAHPRHRRNAFTLELRLPPVGVARLTVAGGRATLRWTPGDRSNAADLSDGAVRDIIERGLVADYHYIGAVRADGGIRTIYDRCGDAAAQDA